MPGKLGEFYQTMIPVVRDGIAAHLPRDIDAAFFTTATGLTPLFEQDHAAIYATCIEPNHEYLAASGKVLRPILAAIIAAAYGCDASSLGQFLGAIEIMEDSSIMMDDYIDNSELRRGIPCAHRAHGFPVANIASCTTFALSHYIFYRNPLGFDASTVRKLLDAVAEEHVHMAYGQLEELYWTESNVNDVSDSQYYQQTIARCAFLSFRGPIRYAAIIASASAADMPTLMRLGEYLLIGYHIKGDDLDMSPDSPAWGKIAGEDITTGRRTLLINYTMRVASESDRTKIEAIVNARSDDAADKRFVYELILKYRAFEHTRAIADQYHARCYNCIEALSIDVAHKSLLREFADFAILKRKV